MTGKSVISGTSLTVQFILKFHNSIIILNIKTLNIDK
ncbi:MAG: hypothetical protein JXB88_21770 [Spirochaetales bacterium]|nr:hypothetical protein [Spirochaetales bacterium]